ncbi:MAG: glycyl-radical enzyme activating protein [Bacteroidales bacterium]|nr:glycyl-radical enzyme activating protein [Bacteroidales bacterium]
MLEAPLFDIKHNSLEDGPGIRSVVFFKGCPLDCKWCQNPEGKKRTPELYWEEKKCIADGGCIDECPEVAISFDFPDFIDRGLCTNCFLCVDVCPSTALKVSGNSLTVDAIIGEILPYKSYLYNSGGGVTLSGGEATLYLKFISGLLQKLKRIGLHTLLQTAGCFDYTVFEELVLPYVDTIYYDIKFISSSEHKKWCGMDNDLILENFLRLHKESLSRKFTFLPRTPLITNITDTRENVASIAAFYKSLSIARTTLLPNNPLWLNKLGCIGPAGNHGMNEEIGSLYPIARQEIVRNQFNEYGIAVDFG